MIEPYEGKEPYIFVSYSHRNKDIVFPIVERLIKDGYRVWYDSGIKPAEEYNEYIAKHINKCWCFISMITPEYFDSYYCKKEMKYSIRKNKQQYPIYLSETVLPDEFDMHIGDIQSVSKYKISNEPSFYDELYSAKILAECKGAVSGATEYSRPKTLALDDSHMVKYVGTNAVECDTSAKRVVIRDGTTCIDSHAFHGCSSLESVVIPSSVTSIGDGAFFECSSLRSITIPCGVISIGNSAFSGCSSLLSMPIPDSVISIGDSAFMDCSSLVSVTLPNGLTSIENMIFCDCTELTGIIIPDNVAILNHQALSGCSKLLSITIPRSVLRINQYALHGCRHLARVYYKGTKNEWNMIIKRKPWDDDTPSYTIHCTDGDITK